MWQIFVSWSGPRSRQLALALQALTKAVLPAGFEAKLSKDLAKGGSWFDQLAQDLEGAAAGILCVTPENRSSPWLLFEAGALIRCSYKVRLYPLLFDLGPAELDGPLSLLQATAIDRDPANAKKEVHELLRQLCHDLQEEENESLVRGGYKEKPLRPLKARAGAWKTFRQAVRDLGKLDLLEVVPELRAAFERKTFVEPFATCTDRRWQDRAEAASLAVAALDRGLEDARLALSPAHVESYRLLRRETDAYAMAVRGNLIEERRFQRGKSGRLTDPHGVLAACDERRQVVMEHYRRLTDPVAPVFEEARRYDDLGTLGERKRLLIQPLENRLRRGSTETRDLVDRALRSPWTWDRLVAYLTLEHDAKLPGRKSRLSQAVERELSRLESLDTLDSLTPLYYALHALARATGSPIPASTVAAWRDRLETVIERANASLAPGQKRWDANRKTRGQLARLSAPGAAPAKGRRAARKR